VPIAAGTQLGQYEVQEFIGQGAMGLVYRAYHKDLERTVAVKVLQAITPDADAVARFRHEAQAIAKFRHPNIVDVYDFGAYEGTPYMIVEYVPGGSLAGRMSRGMLGEAAILKYLRGMAAGLDYAHGRGVVHRDVKPANVLLTEDDTPVLADFGLAKLLQGSSLKSMTGVTTGTPAYMAPEQVTGSKVGPAADRYSLATIAYEMLTGVIPFDGEALMELLYAQVHREPVPPSARNPALSPAVDAVIMRGLAKDPAARWETATGFVAALTAALYGAPAPSLAQTVVMAPAIVSTVPSARTAVAERAIAQPAAASGVAAAAPVPTAQPPLKRKSRLRRVAAIAAGLILLLLIGTIGLAALARGTPTLSLSSANVAPGDDLVVTGAHLPANQSGEVQLWSVLHTFAFRADGSGNVAIDITVPRDIGNGDHLVKLCYGGSCHAQQTLHVVSRVASVTPSPGASAQPTPSATSTPTPSHTPGPSPTPTPYMSVLKYTVKPGDAETIQGTHFPGSTVAISFLEGGHDTALGTAPLSGGMFNTTVRIPSTATAGPAAIRVCYTGGCAYSTISVS
jgi:tRNA A-37 threonylcarbamoyl transferase component Bud32